jgi:hypothetical protein
MTEQNLEVRAGAAGIVRERERCKLRKSTDVLGSRAEGLPVRDVGIASLDALDFVPANSVPPKRTRLKRRKEKERKTSEYSSSNDDTPIICAITIASFAISH